MNRLLRCHAPAFWAVLFAAGGAAAAPPVVVEGPRVVVRSTVAHRPAAKRCRDVLEAALPVFEKHIPCRPHPDSKLVVNLLETRSEYMEALRRMNAEAFTENLAFTSVDTLESYIVLQPRAEPEFLALVNDLPELTRHLALHEAAHQWIYRSDSPNGRWWPAWYVEGMAEYAAESALDASAGPSGSSSFLKDDADHSVIDLIRNNRLLTVERLLYADPATFVRRGTLYAQCRSFYRFLASDPQKREALHEAIRMLGEPVSPVTGASDKRAVRFARPCARALAQVYGPLDALEQHWRKAAIQETPRWFEAIRSAQRSGDEILCAAFPDANSMLMAVPPPPEGPFSLEGELQLTGIGRREAKLFIAFEQRDDPRFIKLDMGIEGFFSFLAIIPYSDGFWQARFRNIAKFPADTFVLRQWIPFRITADDQFIRGSVAGQNNVFNATPPPGFDCARGHWGVGAYDGVMRFRNLKINGQAVCVGGKPVKSP
jgi:hypothetical protein